MPEKNKSTTCVEGLRGKAEGMISHTSTRSFQILKKDAGSSAMHALFFVKA